MFKKLIATGALAAVLMLGLSSPAPAQQYFNVGPSGITITGTPCAGCGIFLRIIGWQGNTIVVIRLFSTPVELGSFRSDAQGVVTAQVTIPSNVAPGSHHIEASGIGANGQPRTVSTGQFTIGGAGVAVPARKLARTGSSNDTVPLAAAGVGLVAVGATLVTVVRRRRSDTATLSV